MPKNRENESEAHNGRQNVETKSEVKMERCYQWHQWTLFNCYHESVHLAQWNSKHFTQKQQALYCYAKGLANLQSGLCLLRVARVTAGLMKSNGSLPLGLWLMSPAGWLPRTAISSGIPCSAIEYGLPLPFFCSYRVRRIVVAGLNDTDGSETDGADDKRHSAKNIPLIAPTRPLITRLYAHTQINFT